MTISNTDSIEQIIQTHSPEETLAWAEAFGRALAAGSVLALYGELGAGKTVVAKGIGRGLGVTDEVISPTFNYILEYSGRLPLYHADLYRIDNAADFAALGFDEYFDRDGIFLIEWPERVRDLLPPDTLWVSITPGENPGDRTITVRTTAA